jgi:hypothetical protein
MHINHMMFFIFAPAFKLERGLFLMNLTAFLSTHPKQIARLFNAGNCTHSH